jgi:hypothetical protein
MLKNSEKSKKNQKRRNSMLDIILYAAQSANEASGLSTGA